MITAARNCTSIAVGEVLCGGQLELALVQLELVLVQLELALLHLELALVQPELVMLELVRLELASV